MDIVTLGMAKADAKKRIRPTRRALFSFGAVRATSSAESDTNVRLPFRLTVKTTRWRLHVINYHLRDNVAYGTINFTGAWTGTHDTLADRAWTGKMVAGTIAQDVPSATLSGGAEYVSPWVTDTARQFDAHTEYLLSYGFTCTASQTNAQQNSRGYVVAGAANASAAAPTLPGLTSATPLGAWIEYEWEGSEQVGLYIGDSLMDGYSAANGWLGQWPALAAMKMGGVAVNGALSGSKGSDWTAGTDIKWTRFNGLTLDYAVVGLGTNDLAFSTSYGTLRNYLTTIYDNVRALGVKRVFGVTIMPSTAHNTTQMDADRDSTNNFLRNNLGGLTGIIDLNDALSDPANADQLNPLYNGDGTHLVMRGYQRCATEAVQSLLPLGTTGRP